MDATMIITESVTRLRIESAEHRVQLGEHSRRIEAQSNRILYGDHRAAELERRIGLMEQWGRATETRMDDLGEKIEGHIADGGTKRLEIIIPVVLVVLAALFKLPLSEMAAFMHR